MMTDMCANGIVIQQKLEDGILGGLYQASFPIHYQNIVFDVKITQYGIRKTTITSHTKTKLNMLIHLFNQVDMLIMLGEGHFIPISEAEICNEDEIVNSPALNEKLSNQTSFFFITKTVRYKDRLIPIRNKTSRYATPCYLDNFAVMVCSVNIVSWLLSSRDNRNSPLMSSFLCNIFSSEYIRNLTQRQINYSKNILTKQNQAIKLVCLSCRLRHKSRGHHDKIHIASALLQFQQADRF